MKFLLMFLLFACSAKQPVKPLEPQYIVDFFQRDLNGDEIVTEAEMVKYHKKIFRAIDKNHDDKISRFEAREAQKEGAFEMFKRDFVSYSDALSNEDERFVAIDLNHNGKIGKAEYKKYYSKNSARKFAVFD